MSMNVSSTTPNSDIGVVDQQEVLQNNQAVALQYQQKLQQTADSMKKDFDTKSAKMTDAEKQKLYNDMSQQFAEKRAAIEKDMQGQLNRQLRQLHPEGLSGSRKECSSLWWRRYYQGHF